MGLPRYFQIVVHIVILTNAVLACYIYPKELNDPCREKQCAFGSRCIATPDGRNATCQCPERCPGYGDHIKSKPVCGSDGKDYKDECELQKFACFTKTNITVKYQGKCDPCGALHCTEPEICQLDENRNPVCRCGDTCTLEFTPVCGSDGKTYFNGCSLRQESCRLRKPLRIVYRGKCSSGVNPCLNVKCESDEECTINKLGIAQCECPPPCEQVMRPVCSKDGRTFSSDCEMRMTACSRRTKIELAYVGVCGEKSLCLRHTCLNGAVCVEQFGIAECKCPTCTVEFDPVCGSDGISYSNACKLRLEACKHKRNITILYDGPCSTCEKGNCHFDTTCKNEEDINNFCNCPNKCDSSSEEDSTVCGSDGVTYTNECNLKQAACKLKRPLEVLYKGSCATVLPHAPYRQFTRTSHVENVGADALNQVQREACRDIHCDYGATCEVGPDDFPSCTCHFNCTNQLVKNTPVCASDLRIYPSICAMNLEACQRQEELRLRPLDLCQGMQVKPCNGDEPLRDILTGKELDCGNGPTRQDCPPGSYCHQTAHFAKCCQKMQKDCEDSWYGCCPDGRTAAQSTNHAGCPSLCNCNKLGSYTDSCDPQTKQCNCKPGVGGLKCDRCEPGYWGLPKISSGHEGCIPCGCSSFGSVREDCEQMTGRCVCKPGIQGQKCTVCSSLNKILSSAGCISDSRIQADTTKELSESKEFIRKLSKVTRHISLLRDEYHFSYGGLKKFQSESSALYEPGSNVYLNEDHQVAPAYRPTPATVDAVTIVLGNSCSDDIHCSVMNSFCYNGKCMCTPGYNETADQQLCLPAEKVKMERELFPCKSSPCASGSTCLNSSLFSFNCICTEETTGKLCDIPILRKKYYAISFNGHSYLKLRPLNAYLKLSVEIEFKAYAEDGILLYNQQSKTENGDFVSISLVKGYVEFRYNLGNGSVKIRSLDKIQLQTYNKIVIKRYYRDGILQINDEEVIKGKSIGTLKALDLNDDAYIGYVPYNDSKVFENIGTTVGFLGCIKIFKIGRNIIDINAHRSNSIIEIFNVQDCDQNACLKSPCLNDGVCYNTGKDKFLCLCKSPFSGRICDTITDVRNSKQVQLPEFTGNSYIRYKKLNGISKDSIVEISFFSKSTSGLLLYCGQLKKLQDDFLAILLSYGHVQFLYNLGSGIANITANESINLNTWYTVKFYRTGRHGHFVFNNSTSSGFSKPPFTELNVESPLYIGSVPSKVSDLSEEFIGFKGYISYIRINKDGLLLSDTLPKCSNSETENDICSLNLKQNVDNPCLQPSANNCMNSGVCIPLQNSFKCKCPKNFTGKLCEKRYNWSLRVSGEKSLLFRSFLPNRRKYQEATTYKIKLRTSIPNGLVLWQGRGKNNKRNYLSVALVNGYTELSYNLDRDDKYWAIKSSIRVSDAKWHTILIKQRRRGVFLSVDSELPIRGHPKIAPNSVKNSQKLWIGGFHAVPAGFPLSYYAGFHGCINYIYVNNKPVNLLKPRNAVDLEFCNDNDV